MLPGRLCAALSSRGGWPGIGARFRGGDDVAGGGSGAVAEATRDDRGGGLQDEVAERRGGGLGGRDAGRADLGERARGEGLAGAPAGEQPQAGG